MNNRLPLRCLFGILCFCLPVASQIPSSTTTKRQPVGPTANAKKSVPVNRDNQQAVQYVWDTILTKCGDNWYYGASKLGLEGEGDKDARLWEYKGVTFQFSVRSVSRAEALNGVTWKGIARMTTAGSCDGQASS